MSAIKRILIVAALATLIFNTFCFALGSFYNLNVVQAQVGSLVDSSASLNRQKLDQLTEDILNMVQNRDWSSSKRSRSSRQVSPSLVTTNQLKGAVAARNELLLQLMREDSGQFLQVALPANVLAMLPESARSYFEQHVELDGELIAVYEDYETHSRLRHFLKTKDKQLELYFAGSPPALLTGTRVRVRGVRVGDELALDGDLTTTTSTSKSTGMQVTATATTIAPNTFGEQKTLVILVNFQDKATQPWTVESARNVVFNSVSNFDLENSYGQTWLTGDVAGWYTIPTSYTACDTSAIAYYARQAAQAAGYNVADYNRLVYGFPSAACGGWVGMAYFGGNPSQAWINGSFGLSVIGHEMGHNFGLYHSKSLDCGSQVIGVVGSGCTSNEYGDIFDIMGNSTKHFNASQKAQIGWLGYGSSPAITTVETSGTYWIDAYASPGGTKALKILKSTDPKSGMKTWYYVEARRAIGFDSSLSNNTNMLNGVVMHTGPDSGGTPIYLLDMTPETTSWGDPALVVGQSFTDTNAGVTITTVSANSTGAMVNVSLGPLTCVSTSPALSLSPGTSGWVKPGTAVNYTVSITNYDNSGCVASSFNLEASTPSGWSASFANSTLTISPGGTASTTLTVTSPTSATDGSYNIEVSATNMSNTGYAASKAVTYVAASSLGVSLVTDRTSYTRNQTVASKATVLAMGAPVAGAAVTFTITKPNGVVVTSTLVTGMDGSATFKYKFKRTDPAGAYLETSSSSMNGLSGSATTAFTVQ